MSLNTVKKKRRGDHKLAGELLFFFNNTVACGYAQTTPLYKCPAQHHLLIRQHRDSIDVSLQICFAQHDYNTIVVTRSELVLNVLVTAAVVILQMPFIH